MGTDTRVQGFMASASTLSFRAVVRSDKSVRELSDDEALKVAIVLGDGELLTTNQAAQLLDVSRPMVVRWINDGLLPDHPVGSQHRISRDSVMALKAKRLEISYRAMSAVRAARTDSKAARATAVARAAAAERRARITG